MGGKRNLAFTFIPDRDNARWWMSQIKRARTQVNQRSRILLSVHKLQFPKRPRNP